MCKKIIDAVVMFIINLIDIVKVCNLNNIIKVTTINVNGKEVRFVESKEDDIPTHFLWTIKGNPDKLAYISMYLNSKVLVTAAANGSFVNNVPHIIKGYNCLPEYVNQFLFQHEVGHIMDDSIDWDNLTGCKGMQIHLSGKVNEMEEEADEYAVDVLGPQHCIDALFYLYKLTSFTGTVGDIWGRICLINNEYGVEPVLHDEVTIESIKENARVISSNAGRAIWF